MGVLVGGKKEGGKEGRKEGGGEEGRGREIKKTYRNVATGFGLGTGSASRNRDPLIFYYYSYYRWFGAPLILITSFFKCL